MGLRRAGRSVGSARGSYVVALLVLAAALTFTAVLYRVTLNSETNAHQARFTLYAEEVANTLSARFSRYQAILDAAAGLYVSNNGNVSRAHWLEFADTFALKEQYPGIDSLDYIAYVPALGLKAFVASVRADGAPKFAVQATPGAAFYCPITYVASVRTGSDTEGFDPCDGSKIATATLMQARDTGRYSLSAPLDLQDESGALHHGVVAVRPLYRNGADLSSGAARRSALYGWVAETLPMDRVLATQVMPASLSLGVRIEDVALPAGQGIVYDNGGTSAEQPRWWQKFASIQSTYEATLPMGGRVWRLEFSEPPSVAWLAVLIVLAGIMVSVPVSMLVLNLGLTRSRALKLAARMTDSLREQEQMLSSITGNISDGIYRSTPDKGMIYANEALARMFGYTSTAELMSVAGPILYANPRRRQELTQLLDDHGQYRNEEVEYQRQDGTRFYAVNSANTVKGDDGQPIYFDGVISDISDRKRAEAQVYQLAHYDALTGLPNRALLRDRLGQAMHDAKRRGAKLAVMYLDLDRFKNVNDSLGHETGDKLLKAVSSRLRECMRDSDTISRQGGDEFLLILRDVADATAVARVAEKLQEAVAKSMRIGEYELHITPSIGISMFPEDADDIDELIRNADAAMYHAKEKGRFNFQFFTPEMNIRAYERLSLEGSLRHAIERQEFHLHYQPQVDLRSGKVIGVEALLRWNRAGHESVPPSVFVPVLESSGMIGPVGEWVLREACRQNRAWQDQGLPPLPMAVNLSAIQFNRRNMADTISAILAETRLEPRCLELEFTESAVMHDSREVATIIGRLDDLGVQLALDDFGTGYSSLSYLRRFHLDKLKIDQSFVRDIDLDVDDAAIVAAIIGMARNLKVMVVAEGVETHGQCEFLRSHGCDGIQGYLFSKPLTAQDFADLLKSGRTLKI
ncbi:MAG TPA: EAL domain-containing protein [Gammaproteobacteria bacterium]|jgi:diguanylate cyclase (GGDEF)-like protein/PAS domain S-box-containing protein